MSRISGYLHKQPMKKVVKEAQYVTKSHPFNTFSWVLTLECGHQIHRKGSVPVPRRAHCYQCEKEIT